MPGTVGVRICCKAELHKQPLEVGSRAFSTSFVSLFLGFVGVLTYNNCLAVPGLWDVTVQLLQEMLNQKAWSDDQILMAHKNPSEVSLISKLNGW